jgi:hypothetical protein
LNIGLYIGSWPQNIGNAFFDFGAKAILAKAFPEARFFPTGGAVHWMFTASALHNAGKIGRKLGELAGRDFTSHNSFEIGEAAEVDLLVFAGMSMCEEFVRNNGKTFRKAAERGTPILGLGAGASLYTAQEADVFSQFLKDLGRYAIITRDDDTFDMFSSRLDNIWSGIDAAFFLPDYYTPPKLALPPYDIVNFDGPDSPPAITHTVDHIIHTHHDLWGPLPDAYMAAPNTLVSDIPEDYLTLYSQVNETHSNRVHACIATLTYGNKARLYNSTPRKALFEKVGASQVTSEVCRLDMARLQELKDKQIAQARNMVLDLLAREPKRN